MERKDLKQEILTTQKIKDQMLKAVDSMLSKKDPSVEEYRAAAMAAEAYASLTRNQIRILETWNFAFG